MVVVGLMTCSCKVAHWMNFCVSCHSHLHHQCRLRRTLLTLPPPGPCQSMRPRMQQTNLVGLFGDQSNMWHVSSLRTLSSWPWLTLVAIAVPLILNRHTRLVWMLRLLTNWTAVLINIPGTLYNVMRVSCKGHWPCISLTR